MVTTHSEMMHLTFTYGLSALGFIIKQSIEMMTVEIQQLIDRVYLQIEVASSEEAVDIFRLEEADSILFFPVTDIIFFENSVSPNKVILYTQNQAVEFAGVLKEIEERSPSFFRCHRSFIVNLDHVRQINKKLRTLTLSNGDVLDISRRKFRELTDHLS